MASSHLEPELEVAAVVIQVEDIPQFHRMALLGKRMVSGIS
jgi:hypothetical protein